jgi:hypothetical protein
MIIQCIWLQHYEMEGSSHLDRFGGRLCHGKSVHRGYGLCTCHDPKKSKADGQTMPVSERSKYFSSLHPAGWHCYPFAYHAPVANLDTNHMQERPGVPTSSTDAPKRGPASFRARTGVSAAMEEVSFFLAAIIIRDARKGWTEARRGAGRKSKLELAWREVTAIVNTRI